MAVIDRRNESPAITLRLVSAIDLRHRRRCAARVELVQLLPLRFDAQRRNTGPDVPAATGCPLAC